MFCAEKENNGPPAAGVLQYLFLPTSAPFSPHQPHQNTHILRTHHPAATKHQHIPLNLPPSSHLQILYSAFTLLYLDHHAFPHPPPSPLQTLPIQREKKMHIMNVQLNKQYTILLLFDFKKQSTFCGFVYVHTLIVPLYGCRKGLSVWQRV